MTIYVDDTQQYRSGPWCHMATDGEPEELHAFASKLGLKREWFQAHPSLDHYDLRPSKRVKALKLGAIEVSRYDMLILCTDKYPKMKESALERMAQAKIDREVAVVDYLESLKSRECPPGIIVDEYIEKES